MDAQSNSQMKAVEGEYGYVLQDVPHLNDYIPNLPVCFFSFRSYIYMNRYLFFSTIQCCLLCLCICWMSDDACCNCKIVLWFHGVHCCVIEFLVELCSTMILCNNEYICLAIWGSWGNDVFFLFQNFSLQHSVM